MITDKNACESYFYWKGDLVKTFINSVKTTASFFITKVSNCLVTTNNTATAIFCGLAILLLPPAGLLLTVALAILLTALYIAITFAYYVFAWLVWFLEALYVAVNRISVLCPTCNKKVNNPVYVCPKCKLEHTHVVPSTKYGIFHRKCTCGNKIPACAFWKKKSLSAKCPFCNGSITPLEYSPHTIAFIGGKSVGKTFLRNIMCIMLHTYVYERGIRKRKTGHSFFEKVVCSIMNKYNELYCWRETVPKDEQSKIDKIKKEIKEGIRPNETSLSANMAAVRLDLKKGFNNIPNRLYLYDAPGEAFTKEEYLKAHVYYESLQTIILVVDPLSLPNIRYQIPNIKNIAHVSLVSPTSCIEKWLNSMERVHTQGNLDKTLKYVRCAVVITKVDMPELQKLTALSINSSEDECKAFLSDNGEQGLISLVEDKFGEVGYFAVSCTGGKADSVEFTPEGIDKLWSWVLKDS